MDYKKLIENYRRIAKRWECGEQLLLNGELRIQDVLRESADAIATLLVERDAAVEELHGRCSQCKHFPAKLDRSWWEGCEYCKIPSLGPITVDGKSMCENANEMHLRRYNGNMFYLVCVGDYGYEYGVPVFNCPWCGRPLTEEAWTRLEKSLQYGTILGMKP